MENVRILIEKTEWELRKVNKWNLLKDGGEYGYVPTEEWMKIETKILEQ